MVSWGGGGDGNLGTGTTDNLSTPDTVIGSMGVDTVVVTVIPVSVVQVSAGQTFTCWPNPVSSGMCLRMTGLQSGTLYSIHDQLGQAMRTGVLTGVQPCMPVVGLAPGSYLLKIGKGGSAGHARFHVQ
jgi:hypothetical protein